MKEIKFDLDQATSFFEGTLTITFEPLDEQKFHTNLLNYFTILKFNPYALPFNQDYDIKLEVQNREFEFNRASLSKISSVFKEMFETCTSTDGNLPIPNESIQTIETFKHILDGYGSNPIKMTVALCKFADKFDIQPLIKACLEHFAKNLSKENMYEIAILAYKVDDFHLMRKVATFITKNYDDETRNFFEENPECSAKLFQSML